MALLQEQLAKALALASERALAVAKCEPGLVEYKTLVELFEEKLGSIHIPMESPKLAEESVQISLANEALQSTVRSLEKLITCKDETIVKYQALLKEDRDKHSEAAERLQDEIQSLKKMFAERKVPELKIDDHS